MVDCGATALFLDNNFVKRHQLKTFALQKPIRIFNIDGTANRAGQITHFARLALMVDKQEQWTDFLVTDLGGEDIILGLPWLRRTNPQVDWEKGRLSVKATKVTIEDVPEEPGSDRIAAVTTDGSLLEPVAPTPKTNEVPKVLPPQDSSETEEPPLCRIQANRALRRSWVKAGVIDNTTEEVWCAAGYTYSQQLAEQAHKGKPTRTFEEMVPEPYRDFRKVFSETASERLPSHQPWDHAIDLVPGAPETMRTKVYPMSRNEQEELDCFLEENL